MSAHLKKHRTKGTDSSVLYVIDGKDTYAIPKSVAKVYKIKPKKALHREANVPAEEVFESLRKTTKASTLLRGLRHRENLSQVEFAKKISVSQANLSKMENGSRPIGKIVAKRIADAFSVNYRYFLQ